MEEQLINLNHWAIPGFPKACLSVISKPLEKLLCFAELNEAYRQVVQDSQDKNFFVRALKALNLNYKVSTDDMARIPREGPLLVVANHPLGGLDGVALGALLDEIRGDAKLLVNGLLTHMTEIKPYVVAVDPFGGEEAKRDNVRGMMKAIQHLRDGGCLGTFPGGVVSHFRFRELQVTDPHWVAHTARMARKAGAVVLPIFFHGKNSFLFQVAGALHPRLRTLLLIREMMCRKDRMLSISVGEPIQPSQWAQFETDEELSEYLRLKTYLLKHRHPTRRLWSFSRTKTPKLFFDRAMEPLAAPQPILCLQREVDRLPQEQQLVTYRHYGVYVARAEQIPCLLREIGMLREKTFRLAHEGTGRPVDLDDFDDYYEHLFSWDCKEQKLVGAYRLGRVDEILAKYGKDGLYTSTLFKFKSEFLEQLGEAIEMGRSFVIPEYQRKPASLALIFRGIGEYVVRNPRYKTLFGPVSINREYDKLSQDLMIQFLQENQWAKDLVRFVKAKQPPRVRKLRGADKKALLRSIKEVDQVSALVSEIEEDHKGMPVLLRQYLKLNGKLLAFNIDDDFGYCLDGLILVDLTQSDPHKVQVHLGKEGYESFMRYHGKI